MKKRFAVLLSGCGVYDGAEIHEATMTLYAIVKQGATYQIFAPNINQHHVINHLTGEEMNETRNVLVEAARIARGNIKDITDFDANNFDALILPGGFGVAKNFSDFAFKGLESKINPLIEKMIKQMAEQKKPIGGLCISPAILAKIFENADVTIGSDEATAEIINNMGANHKITNHGEVVYDKKYNLYTTPCYMLDATIVDIANGAMNIVAKILGNYN